MSDTKDVVETRGKFRAIIEVDQDPYPPDGDFFGTVYAMERGGHCERVGSPFKSPDDFSDAIKAAWDHYRDMKLVERYLRIFEAVRGFDYFDTRDGKYINCVTDYDLRMWGWEEGDTRDPAEHNLDEWRHYYEGDVYFVAVEKCMSWHTDDEDADPSDYEDWQAIGDTQVGGYYGEKWAREAAIEALDGYAPRPCKVCGKPMKREEVTIDGHRAVGPWPWVHEDGNTSHTAEAAVIE